MGHTRRVNRRTSGYERRVDAVTPRPRHWLAALLVLALGGACATTRPPPTPDAPRVVDLDIQGTDQLSAGDIKERIVTTDTPWWEPFNPFDEGPSYLDVNAWQADLRRIKRFYQAEGYYQAEVVSNEVVPRGEGKVAVRATVQEGQPTTLATINVSGLEGLTAEQRSRALQDLPLERGAIFREDDWGVSKELLRERLREMGYAEAEVGGEVRVDVDTRQAVADLQIRPGLRYRFGNIFVATDANPQVAPRRIIEQTQAAIRKGEWYSETALAEAQARVFGMGVFGAVKVNRGAPDREAGTVPVVVDVREAPFRSIRLGAGLGFDPARNELHLVGEWTNRNFLGGLRRLTVGGRVGYAFLPNLYASVFQDRDDAKDGLVLDLTTEFEQPQFLARDLRLQSSVTLERGLEQAYSFLGGRLRGGVIWQPHPDLSIFPTYNLEVYRLEGAAGADERVPPITIGCGTRTECDIALSYLEQVVEWDRRDDRIEPHNGFFASLSLQQGGGPLLGSFEFIRVMPEMRYYASFGEEQRLTLAARLRLGTLQAPGGFEGSSIVTRFFSGGPQMRGFNSRRLAPQVRVGTKEGETVPVGGNGLFESSLELRYRPLQSLVFAGFYDSGFVGQESLRFGADGLFGDRHYHALGVGLRYLTVVGPIRLDIARRLNIGRALINADPDLPPEKRVFRGEPSCFGLFKGDNQEYAGAPEGLCTFHISIGEAF